jgi:hypothetical protein
MAKRAAGQDQSLIGGGGIIGEPAPGPTSRDRSSRAAGRVKASFHADPRNRSDDADTLATGCFPSFSHCGNMFLVHV